MMQPIYINNVASIHPESNDCNQPYLIASEPDYKTIITDATLRRRMSRIVKMGVACGLECIAQTAPEDIHAIITSTGLGCLADTEKFMNAIIDNKERMLNPTAFIQSTFNTIGAQIALIRQIHAYNVTYVHRGLSFESALLDGILKIGEGNSNVLVGAIDEITPVAYTIQKRLGLLKETQAGEGAQFFLLSSEKNGKTLGEVKGLETFVRPDSIEEIKDKILAFLERNNLTNHDIDWFISGKNGNRQQDAIYAYLENSLFSEAEHITFKNQCGEYHTASSYGLWKVITTFSEETNSARYALIYNHYQTINHSLILIRRI